MEKYVIEGLNKLKGKVRISGAKNSALPIMAAVLLTDEECMLENVPALRDIKIMEEIEKNKRFYQNRLDDNVFDLVLTLKPKK